MRGQRTLFQNILTVDDASGGSALVAKKKGRSAEYDAARNEMLCARYYYYLLVAAGPQLAYEAIVEQVSAEFFLAPITVAQVLQKNIQNINQLKKEKPERQWFTKRWPHIIWPASK